VAHSLNRGLIHQLTESPTELCLRQADGRDRLGRRAAATSEPGWRNTLAPRIVRSDTPPFEPELPLTEGSSLTLGRRWLCVRHYLPRLAPSPTGHGERDQKQNDPHATQDVRNHGDRTGEIARVGPDQAHDSSHDEQGDRSG
jgi:hypothetical protein